MATRLAEIETDKTVVEMEAYNAGDFAADRAWGTVPKLPVGSLLAYIGDADDELPEAVEAPVRAR